MATVDLLFAALFNAAVLFLVTAGLQLIFGVQRIVNLTAGSLYAFGAYFGASVFEWFSAQGGPAVLLLPVLIVAGLLAGQVGFLVERVLRTVYGREEAFQLLMTFAFVLMFQDVLRYVWGAQPRLLADLPSVYGMIAIGAFTFPAYNAAVIACALLVAGLLWWLIDRTPLGHIIRATAENRQMAEALGANTRRINMLVFMLGSMLGTVGGALVIPTTAASLEMPIALIVETFAVVVIGGLGSIRGAFLGALIVGLLRALSLSYFPEMEVMSIYLVVVFVLVLRPYGLFGKAAA
ncbi:branched-chain amino acid ABC transporter permease [Xanthobacter dioxanivorans]|uniref:Branched-chain amino acid ABC transporter permease n=1 Tax=Xanthobacter dioxanivorans TaxID=2528964 RepID=A0A974SGY2_9HYPH|nr:branched-chain amino acid ABC transporter permease [Xanthobacter dioxanivorans]QRG05741.1 branched-chain amino acid ABC transporter permease [Xanthobacter dioxanivorans]